MRVNLNPKRSYDVVVTDYFNCGGRSDFNNLIIELTVNYGKENSKSYYDLYNYRDSPSEEQLDKLKLMTQKGLEEEVELDDIIGAKMKIECEMVTKNDRKFLEFSYIAYNGEYSKSDEIDYYGFNIDEDLEEKDTIDKLPDYVQKYVKKSDKYKELYD